MIFPVESPWVVTICIEEIPGKLFAGFCGWWLRAKAILCLVEETVGGNRNAAMVGQKPWVMLQHQNNWAKSKDLAVWKWGKCTELWPMRIYSCLAALIFSDQLVDPTWILCTAPRMSFLGIWVVELSSIARRKGRSRWNWPKFTGRIVYEQWQSSTMEFMESESTQFTLWLFNIAMV